MDRFSRKHLSDDAVLTDLKSRAADERRSTAQLLASIAEVDARRLFVPAGCSSMFVYCVSELHFSESAAYDRIEVARLARRFPALFEAFEQGRLHLTAIRTLGPVLTHGTVDELIAAAAHK